MTVTIIALILPEESSAVEIKIGLGVAFCGNRAMNPAINDKFSSCYTKTYFLCSTCAGQLRSCWRAAVWVMPCGLLGKLVCSCHC